MPEHVGHVDVECPVCGTIVHVKIVAREYPVNDIGQLRIGLEPRYQHTCTPRPQGPGDGERLAS